MLELIKIRITDVLSGLKTVPKPLDLLFSAIIFAVFSFATFIVVMNTTTFEKHSFPLIINISSVNILLLLAVNCVYEETLFRGLLLPHKKHNYGLKKYSFFIAVNVIIFILWHPFIAYITGQSYQHIFFDKIFLLIAGLLGLTCALTYIISGSLWVPILIHTTTVFIWLLKFSSRSI